MRDVAALAKFRGGEVLPEEQGLGLIGAIRGELPTESFDKIRELFLALREAPKAGMITGEDVAAFGALAGGLTKVAPGKTTEDIADLAKAVSEMAGRFGGKFEKGGIGAAAEMVAAGISPETALGLTLASLERTRKVETAGAIAPMLAKPEVMALGATPEERLQKLLGSPEMIQKMFGSQAADVTSMMGGRPMDAAAALRTAQTGNLFQQRIGEIGATPGGKDWLEDRMRQIREERADIAMRPEADIISDTAGEIKTRERESGSKLRRALAGLRAAEAEIAMFFGVSPETAAAGTLPVKEPGALRPTDTATIIAEMTAALLENTEATKANTDASGGRHKTARPKQ